MLKHCVAAYGIVARAEANIAEAKKLNMTYTDYVSTYLQQVRLPTGEHPQASLLTRTRGCLPASLPTRTRGCL